jgi:Bacterial Ig-like domain
MLPTQFTRSHSIAPIVFSLTLAACGGGGHSSPPPVSAVSSSSSSSSSSTAYTVGGMVSGLNGTVVLQNNSGNDLTLTANSAFIFSTALASGTAYAVTVKTQPSSPAQSCVVTNGSGTVSTANVTNVVVTCTTLLTITSTTPLDNAVNVVRTTTPVIQFSAVVNPSTITNSNITLTSPVGSKNTTFSVSGNQVTIQPAGQLLPLTQYTLTTTPAVRGQAGEVLPNSVTTKFTAADGAWNNLAAEVIEHDPGNASVPQIAFDASGNALAVWRQTDGTRYNIWSNRYVAGTGWGATATLIETDNAGDAAIPQIAVEAGGNAMAVWRENDGTRYNIWANHFVAGMGWGAATLIETDNVGDANYPQIAVDSNGNAMAVWGQTDGTRFNINANRYVAGTGWGTPTLIETDNAGAAVTPRIAVDASGNIFAVWQENDGTRTNIWANRYAVGTGWGTAALIETNNAGGAYSPQIAVDANGNALAVWSQSDGTRYNIWSNRYVAGTGWGTATLIETDNLGDANYPQVAVDVSGNALAVWEQSDGTRTNIWANRYVVGTGWGTAALIETDNAGDANIPQIAIDASGNAIAVWQQSNGTYYYIWTNRFVVGTGWGTAARIEVGNLGDAQIPQIAVDASGNALAVWQESDGTRTNVWANRFQ